MSWRSANIKRVAQSYLEESHNDKMIRIAETLQERVLVNPDFERAKEIMRAAFAAMAEKIEVRIDDTADIEPGQPSRDRRLDYFALHMVACRRDNDRIAAMAERVHIAADRFTSCWRQLPLVIHSQHTDQRYIGRQRLMEESHPLRFGEESFYDTVALSVALGRVLGELVGSQPVPCVLPHRRGFFLGGAASYSMQRPETIATGMVRRPRPPLNRKKDHYRGQIPGDVIDVNAQIDIHSFVTLDDFRGVQERLHRTLLAFCKGRKEILRFGVEAYTEGPLCRELPDFEAKYGEWKKACDELKDIVQASDWQAESQRTLQGKPKKSLEARASL